MTLMKLLGKNDIKIQLNINIILRILERALEKINGTSQWVPISWVYWPPDNQDLGKTEKFIKNENLNVFFFTDFVFGNI